MKAKKSADLAPDNPWIERRLSVTVYYEDTDFSGYVYHANYLKFFERGREELLGTDFLRELYQTGYHFVVGRAEISYHKPAKHADRLTIVSRMRVQASPVTLFEHAAYLAATPGAGESETLLVSASVKLVGVDSGGKVARPPAALLDHFRKLL